MTGNSLLDMARDLDARGVPHALVTVVRAIAPTSAYVGAQAIVLGDGSLHGWIGGGCAKEAVIQAALAALDADSPKLIRITNDRVRSDDDVEEYAMSCASNGTIELFIQPYSARNALCVLGSTPAADEARFLATRLNIRLYDVPDRAPVVLVATQGQGDEEALESALRSSASKVLMIASRRKTERLKTAMRMRGVIDAQLARLDAPAGPDAGAKTPGEIALVAMVGVLAFLRGRGSTQPIRDAAPSAQHAVNTATAEAVAGGEFVNPVCGIAVSIANAKHTETFERKVYYFCCDGCWTAFRENPAKYAAIHRASIARSST